MTQVLDAIARIHDVFERWRELGNKKLPDGTELIGQQSEGDEDGWMHVVFPRLDPARIAAIEQGLGCPLPVDSRRFFSACGGMILFGGVFRFYGRSARGRLITERGPAPDDVVALNHELDHHDWKPPGAVALAVNEWDSTLYVAGMGDGPDEILRVRRASGEVLERVENVWTLVADKLYRLDEMFLK